MACCCLLKLLPTYLFGPGVRLGICRQFHATYIERTLFRAQSYIERSNNYRRSATIVYRPVVTMCQ
jgi:hypothetical protein